MTEEAMFTLFIAAGNAANEEERKKAVSVLAEFVYTRFYQFRLDCKDEDIRSDYVVWIYPRLGSIIVNYDPEKASFRTYLNWVVRLSFRTFMRNRYSIEARQRAYETEETTRLMSMDAEWNGHVSECETGYRKEIGIRPDVQLSDKQKEIRARKIFLLACKAGNFMDDSMIQQVAELTGYGENYIRTKLDIIQKSGEKNRERILRCQEKRNGYYIRARKCLVEMGFFEKDSARYAALEKEYAYCRRRWNDLRTGRSAKIKPPSNRFLAGTLGISRGTIDSTLASAMHDGYDHFS